MKIIVSVIASDNEIYNQFKDVWIKTITEIKNTDMRDIFDFYFVYSEKTKRPIVEYEHYTDFNDLKSVFLPTSDNKIITKSILNRSIELFKHLWSNKYSNSDDKQIYILRTNLSTFFDFKKLHTWCINKPTENFFGGSINGFYNFENTTLSGTNMVFSYDIMIYLIQNYLKCDLRVMLEDEAISRLIIQNVNVFLINIKRIDFLEMEPVILPSHVWPATPHSIVYHKCKINDNSIFCYRFKTFNRNDDIVKMNLICDNIYKESFNLNKTISNISKLYKPNLSITEEASEYGSNYSERPFKIINLKFVEDIQNQFYNEQLIHL